MNAYIYKAALVCEDCGDAIRRLLTVARKAPDNPADETTYDSDDYPKGPFPNGGGESDAPQHCDCGDECVNAIEITNPIDSSLPPATFKVGAFLENPLTRDGIDYVVRSIAAGPYSPVAEQVWAEFYRETIEHYHLYHAFEMADEGSYYLYVNVDPKKADAELDHLRSQGEPETTMLGTVVAMDVDEALARIRVGKWEWTQKI